MTTRELCSVTLDTCLAGSATRTGIVVPEQAITDLGAGRRPAVYVDVNGFRYRSTVAVMNGQHLVSVSAAVREATGLKAGDPLHVTLTAADTPREVNVPDDLAAALAEDAEAAACFSTL